MRTVCILLVIALATHTMFAQAWTRILPTESVELRDPRGISVSADGMLYVADTGHHRVIAVNGQGVIVAETGGFGSAHGQFQWPRAVVADRGNIIWVLDYGNRRIETFSRSLEYQGTLEIAGREGESCSQPEAMAVSPQGDLYVYDRDGSRLLHYDPLFRLLGDLGARGGAQFISNVAAMTFVPKQGLYWWSRGSDEISRADALLNTAPARRLGSAPKTLWLAADSCLLYGNAESVFSVCGANENADSLLLPEAVKAMPLERMAGFTTGPEGSLYILDGAAGAVYRIRVQE